MWLETDLRLLSSKALLDLEENLRNELSEIIQECADITKKAGDKERAYIIGLNLMLLEHKISDMVKVLNDSIEYEEVGRAFQVGAEDALKRKAEDVEHDIEIIIKSLREERQSIDSINEPLKDLIKQFAAKAQIAGLCKLLYEARFITHTGFTGNKG